MMYKKLFERTFNVCLLDNQNRDRDMAYNFIKKIAVQYTNFTGRCPVIPGLYSLRNYKFDSKTFPPVLKVTDMNLTLKGEYCSGRKWKQNDPSCFISLLFRVRFLN